MEAQWMATDERFVDNRARLRNDDDLSAQFYGWAAGVTKHEAYERAGGTRAPISPVNTVADLLASPHLRERGFFHDIVHPVAGALPYPGAPARMSATPAMPSRAPLLGEHNADVYGSLLGMAPRNLVRLRTAGVV
jgi:crotonobetainyl-CoA:carnitine CoA-transferase CaiB-like acyl-CoA transferase